MLNYNEIDCLDALKKTFKTISKNVSALTIKTLSSLQYLEENLMGPPVNKGSDSIANLESKSR